MGSLEDQAEALLLADPKFTSRFTILRPLGGGAAGIVYLVRDAKRNGEEVAFKYLFSDGAFDDHTIERFVQELRICQEIDHPNLVAAYDLVRVANSIAFTMEYVAGEDLQARFAAGRTKAEDIDSTFVQLLSALSALHERGIVHRDIKMENILLSRDGPLKLSDLGLLKRLDSEKGLTRTGILLGTAQYMPPEYIKQSRYDERGDLYAVGMMLMEILIGKRWLSELSGMQAIEHLIRSKFEVPTQALAALPKKYLNIITRALEQSPARRFQNAGEMQEAFLSRTGVPAGTKVRRASTGIFGRIRIGSRAVNVGRLGLSSGAAAVLGVTAIVAASGMWTPSAPLAIEPGRYVGQINMFGNTGFFKQIELLIEPGYGRIRSGLEGCEKGEVDPISGSGKCGRYTLTFRPEESGGIAGEIADSEGGKRHTFEALRKR